MDAVKLGNNVLKPILTQHKSILGQLKLPIVEMHIEPEKKVTKPTIMILENELKKVKQPIYKNELF